VVGCYWGPWAQREPEQSRAADEQLFAAVAKGVLQPRISDVLPMASFADGLRRLARREVMGRVVLRVKQEPEALT
jgi:NADPH2:quinone reductase